MPRALRLAFALAAGLALLAGCASPPPRPAFADLRFTAEPPIRLDVAAIDLRSDYKTPFHPPNVEHLFPVTPEHAAENWAHDRLQPAGGHGRAVFILRKASAIETDLPKTEGITSTFTTQASQRYDLALEASVQIIDEHGLALRAANVTIARSQSVLEDITPNERDQVWYDMTKAAMADFDAQMLNEIRNNFGLYYER